jgi:ABC-type spermidine/putrescine transport system permease subunit II
MSVSVLQCAGLAVLLLPLVLFVAASFWSSRGKRSPKAWEDRGFEQSLAGSRQSDPTDQEHHGTHQP